MERTKIVRIIARLNIGGPAIHTILLTGQLNKNLFNSILLSGNIVSGEGDMAYLARENGIKVEYIPGLSSELKPFQDLAALIRITRVLLREKPDIVHTHTAKAGTLGRSAALLYNLFRPRKDKKTYLVHTFHGHVFSCYFGPMKTRLFILIEQFLALFTKAIITVSDSVKADLVRLKISRPDKIMVIPLGFELGPFLSLTQPNEKEMLCVGIVGRLVPIKNHRLFLEGTSLFLAAQGAPKTVFKIIGDGQLRKELEKLTCDLRISEHVKFEGWKPNSAAIYAGLDILVLTSLNEGTPVSIIEAMAGGRPVIATEVGGVRDLLGPKLNGYTQDADWEIMERGVLLKRGNPKGLAKALGFLADNKPLRNQMGKRAREYISQAFSKKRLLKDMETLYLNLMAAS